jgi:hypothetical protein
MHKDGRNMEDSFLRTQGFLSQNPLVDALTDAGTQAKELDDVIVGLGAVAVEQEASSRTAAVQAKARDEARRELYKKHLRPIAMIAKEIFGRTGIDKAFRLPRSSSSNQPLLAAAAAMADAAERAKDAFLARGLPADFVDKLRAAAARVDTARKERRDSARRHVTSTAAVEDLLRRGRSAVRQLDALLRPRLEDDPALLAAWESAILVRSASIADPEKAGRKSATPDIQKVA